MRIVVGRAGDRRDAFVGCVVTTVGGLLLMLPLLTLLLGDADAMSKLRR